MLYKKAGEGLSTEGKLSRDEEIQASEDADEDDNISQAAITVCSAIIDST